MTYGYFDDEKREYVITNPKTPVKWINYIGTLGFGGFVDHTGGALLCKGDPSDNRITKYIQQMPASDFKGTTLYLRKKEKSGYRIFSPFFVPTIDPYESYECHVGLGYTRICSVFYGVKCDAFIFVPVSGEPCELRDIVVTNVGGEPIEVDAVPVVEYTHPFAVSQYTNADWVPQTMMSECLCQNDGRTILAQYPFMFKNSRINYFTSQAVVSSFETDRRRFLGDNEYGTWQHPLSLDKPELSSYEARRGDNIAALMIHLGRLAPGESSRVITQLGQDSSTQAVRERVKRFYTPQAVDTARNELAAFWDERLSCIRVNTPDEAFNHMLNVHNPRQCFITANWSRYLSLYQLGLGTRGIGFRDTSQDVLGVLDRFSEKGRELIVKLLSAQKADGSAMHQFNPLTMVGSEGDSLERSDRPHYYGDDHLWVVLAACAYIRETGDTGFLDLPVPFYDKGSDKKPAFNGTVREHLAKALEFSKTNIGSHNLPLLGFADWNDCVNLPAGAESLFNANLYGKALMDMIDLCTFCGDSSLAAQYAADHQTMKTAFNACAWDGEWFVRYFDHDGSPLGSNKNTSGKIYINGQSWPVISGFAEEDKARVALDSVRRLLNTPKGIKMSWPGFNGFDPAVGGVTTYPPGAKENGGIFLHTNPWVIIAETVLGRGDRAFEYYRQINPAAKNDAIDEYEIEPYVYGQNILGDEHPQFGLGRNSWLSGTASWMYQAGITYVLGIRPAHDGLVVDPCIPSEWPGFSVTRIFRGCTYKIMVENPQGICKGISRIFVDGDQIKGNILPVMAVGSEVTVRVVMGKI
jgi:cellobiose phosphorylase